MSLLGSFRQKLWLMKFLQKFVIPGTSAELKKLSGESLYVYNVTMIDKSRKKLNMPLAFAQVSCFA